MENNHFLGFTIVTTGRKRESLTGNATMHLYPHFKPLTEIDGMINYLATEVTTRFVGYK